MRKYVSVGFILAMHVAFAQINSGSTVIINFTKDQLVMAADSRGINFYTRVPDDTECKIAAFGNQFIFGSVGNNRYVHEKPPAIDPLNDWDNTQVAKHLSEFFARSKNGNSRVEVLTQGWTDSIAWNWRLFYSLNPRRVETIASKGEDALTFGMFAGANKGAITFRVGAIKLDRPHAMTAPILEEVGELSACSPCGEGSRICAAGVHLDFVANFCSKVTQKSRIHIHTKLTNANRNTKLAVKIVEEMIKVYDKKVGDVGGPVDVVTLGNDGSITWNAIKGNCPQN